MRKVSMSTNSSRYRSANRRACSSSAWRSTSLIGPDVPGSAWRSAGTVGFVAMGLLREHRTQLEERHVERQQQAGDHDAHDDEQYWFDERDEPLHRCRDLFVVEIGDRIEHVLQGTGRLANFRHLHGHFRKDRKSVV